MKLLLIHADYLKFEAKKKAIKDAEEVSNPIDELKECLVVFMAVEKVDEQQPENILEQLITEIITQTTTLQTNNVVLYPYAHLSSDLGSPQLAVQLMKDAERLLKEKSFVVKRAPFGWYKSFEISCKGHPLSELSRQLLPEGAKSKGADKPFEQSSQQLSKEEQVMLSASFPLAYALRELQTKAEFGILGFHQGKAYLDVSGLKIKGDDLKLIENRVKKLIKTPNPISPAPPQGRYQELIAQDLGTNAYNANSISLIAPYNNPFVQDLSNIKTFKCVELASAYWKNNSANEQLQRIYFVAFSSHEELKAYEELILEADRRDHRKIGSQLNLFSMQPEAPGMPFFHDNGTYIYRQLENFMTQEMTKLGYEFNKTPMILNKKLWLQSGHWDHYKENMYFTKIDNSDYAVKPMNCPGNILVFKNTTHSYKELPIKAGEYGVVHRHELSGVLSGLFRVRFFTQDDAHVFCTQEQLKEQIIELIDLVDTIYSAFGFEYTIELSTKPEKAMGDPKLWTVAEEQLSSALKERKIHYKLNPGDGAFYGPKIDFHVKDAIGRKWQCGTIQLDFQMPEKFELNYEGADSKKHRPVMLHRAIYGSYERFIGILIEHYAGRFPLWLSPHQVRVITVNDQCAPYAKEVLNSFLQAGFRASLDQRTETIGKKVRDAQLLQYNYVITVGEKEVSTNTIAVRSREGETRFDVKAEEFIKELVKQRETRSQN